MTIFLWQMYLHVCMAQQMICLVGANSLAQEMTQTSGDMHDNKARTQSAAKMVPISRRQARLAAFLIIYEVEKRRKRKRRWWVRPWHNLLSILLLFRHNAFSLYFYFYNSRILYSKGFLEFLTPLIRQKLLDPSNHELTPPSWLRKKRLGHYYALTDSATFSVPSHAHGQTITCDNFYFSHKNWRASFSANEFDT